MSLASLFLFSFLSSFLNQMISKFAAMHFITTWQLAKFSPLESVFRPPPPSCANLTVSRTS